MPKVAIIIPVYNVEKYLVECLDSVIAQTLKDIEIICVNDCSPDNSLEILQTYKEKDPRFKIINLPQNGGLGNARNVALKSVTADYIMFLDSDDFLETDACELAYNQIENNKNDFVIFGINKYNEVTKEKKFNRKRLSQFSSILGKNSVNPIQIATPFFTGAECWYKIYNTKFFFKNSLHFEKGAYEDQLFNVKIFTTAKSISVLEKPLYNYRYRESSISNTPKYWKDYIASKQKVYNSLKSENFQNSKFMTFWLVSAVDLLISYYKHMTNDLEIKNQYYEAMRNFFLQIEKENNTESLFKYSNRSLFKLILKNKTSKDYQINKFVKYDLFSITEFFKYYLVLLFCIKFKIKKRKPKLNNKLQTGELNIIKSKLSNSQKEGNYYSEFCQTNNKNTEILNDLQSLGEFYYLPNKGNLGDIAIACACYQYFDSNNLKYKVVDMSSHRTRKFKQPFTLAYGGGGLFCSYYRKSYQHILEIFRSKNLQRAVILPASFYDCDEVLDILDERFTVYCREKQSFDYCTSRNTKAKFILADDMVFGLNLNFYKAKNKYDNVAITETIVNVKNDKLKYLYSYIYPFYTETVEIINAIHPEVTNNVGYFYRTDKESTTSTSNQTSIIDLSLVANSFCADKSFCIILLRQFLDTLNKFSVIVTDRLHIGICAMLLGKKVYLIDNSYKKVSNVYKNSMTNCDNVKLIKDITEIVDIEDLGEEISHEINSERLSFEEFLEEYASIKSNFIGEKRLWRK